LTAKIKAISAKRIINMFAGPAQARTWVLAPATNITNSLIEESAIMDEKIAIKDEKILMLESQLQEDINLEV
jgi:hypothetical protein